ncbi:MAG: iron ABC transporter permease [Anaerolineae bacterium]|nr:iron ABC transporter permease [Anaerolineae bacterium]
MDRDGSALKWLMRVGRHGLWFVPLAFLAIFFAYPLVSILGVGFAPEGKLDLTGLIEIASSSYYLQTLGFTLGQAVISTLLTLLLAVPGAFVFTHYRFPGRSIFAALAALPFVLPTVVVAAAFLALIGPRGLVNQALMSTLDLTQPPIQLERTLTIILLAHVFYNYGVAFRLISAFWANRSLRIEEAARILGARGWRLWWHVRLPILRPALIAAATLVFIYTFTSFGVIVILGGPRFATLEVEIYRQVANIFDLPVASALSVVQIAFMFVAIGLYNRLEKRAGLALAQGAPPGRPPRNPGEWLMIAANQTIVALFLIAPLLALVARSFTTPQGALTLNYYAGLGENLRGSVLSVPPLQAVGTSIAIALVATALTVILGLMAARALTRRSGAPAWLETVFMLPLATSAVVLGFGFNVALDAPPLNLRTSVALLPIAHTLVALPFVLRSIVPALRSLPAHVEEAAQVLGANPIMTFWRIQLPLISRALAVASVFAFTMSMGEFGASLFVARPNNPTLPIAIFRLLGQPGEANYGRALALSSILLFVCAVGFALIERTQPTSDRTY